MRERKLRAWHKAEKRMFHVDMIDFVYKQVYEFISKGQSACDDVKHYSFDEVELMDFTGLTDKNGLDIYEGDLVKCYKPNTWLDGKDIMEVRFKPVEAKFGYFCFRIGEFATTGQDKLMNIGNNKNGAWCEIIGNKFEQSELIKAVL